MITQRELKKLDSEQKFLSAWKKLGWIPLFELIKINTGDLVEAGITIKVKQRLRGTASETFI